MLVIGSPEPDIEPGPDYKQNFSVNYAEFCCAEILTKDFLVKSFAIAIFQRKLRQKSFVGSGPELQLNIYQCFSGQRLN